MKRLWLPVFACLFLAACDTQTPGSGTSKPQTDTTARTTPPEDETEFRSLASKVLLERLFDHPRFDSSGAAIWKPNYYERLALPVSYDGACHTNIDTILYFKGKNTGTCACVILTMYKYRRGFNDSNRIDTGDCHFCGVPIGIALLEETKRKTWQLYKFEKVFASLGYFGEYRTGKSDSGTISLREVGDGWTALSLKEGVGGNMGLSRGSESFYAIERYRLSGFPNNVLSPLFSYDYYYSNEPLSDEQEIAEEKTELNFIKNKGQYYDFKLTVTKNGRENKTETHRYTYSEEYNQYVSKK